MIRVSRSARVFVHDGPADMRKSYDTLMALVQKDMGSDLLKGDLFLFIGKDRKRAKVLFFDGTGVCIVQKRLSKGRFHEAWQRREIKQGELRLFLRGSVLVWKTATDVTASDMLLEKSAFG